MNFRSDLMNTKMLQNKIVHMIHGDAWVLWSSWLWVCLFYALNVTGPASKSQIPQRGEEVFHFLLKEAIAVFCVLTGPFRVSQFDLKHSFSFSLLLHLLLKSLHLRTHRWTRLFQPAEGRTQMCEWTIQISQHTVTYERVFRRDPEGPQLEREKNMFFS